MANANTNTGFFFSSRPVKVMRLHSFELRQNKVIESMYGIAPLFLILNTYCDFPREKLDHISGLYGTTFRSALRNN